MPELEILLVCALLLCSGLMTETDYHAILDFLFQRKPEADILLELEWNSSDLKASIALIRNYCFEHEDTLRYAVFGRFLLHRLNILYTDPNTDFHSLCKKMYSLWKLLPERIQYSKPYHILNYVEDPLAYGDEAQSRKLFEEMLQFYENKPESH